LGRRVKAGVRGADIHGMPPELLAHPLEPASVASVKRVLSKHPEVRRAFIAGDARKRGLYVLGVAFDHKKVAAVGAAAALSTLQAELDLLHDVSLYAVELDAHPTLEQQRRWHDVYGALTPIYQRRQRWKGPLAVVALVFLATEVAVLAVVTPGLYAPSLDGLVRLHVRLMISNRDTTKPPGPFAPMSVVGADGRHYACAKLKRIRWRTVHADVVWVRDVYLIPSAAAHGSKLDIGGRLLALHV
jgi:hypothetical protein